MIALSFILFTDSFEGAGRERRYFSYPLRATSFSLAWKWDKRMRLMLLGLSEDTQHHEQHHLSSGHKSVNQAEGNKTFYWAYFNI